MKTSWFALPPLAALGILPALFATPAAAVTPPSFYVTCSAAGNTPRTCQFGFDAADVTVKAQRSAVRCIEDTNWSTDGRSVTVRSGCGAEFEVDMRTERPHVVVLTDIGQDPDDTQSLIRTLLYSNDISLKAIIPTYRPGGRPVATDMVRSVIAAYDRDLPRLQQHDIRFPRGEILLKRLKPGLAINDRIGAGQDSAGSNYIINVVDAAEVPVWVLVWGGSRELAQAIHRVRNSRSASAFRAFQNKLRVYSISMSQYSPEPGDYLAANAKDMFWIISASYEGTGTATFRGMYLLGDTSMQRESWIRANILNRGSLGALYPLNTNQDGMKEGDSPSLLHVLPIGLSDPSLPRQGGWGGRYTKEPAYSSISRNIYTSQYQEDLLNGVTDRRASVARWRPAFQSDFAARAAWLEQSYADANHPPDARIVGGNARTVRSGSTVTLDAGPSTDPDGDGLSYRWWVDREAGNVDSSVPISNSTSRVASLRAPAVSATQRVEIVLEVRDSGSPASTRYQRVTLTVTP